MIKRFERKIITYIEYIKCQSCMKLSNKYYAHIVFLGSNYVKHAHCCLERLFRVCCIGPIFDDYITLRTFKNQQKSINM